MSFGFARAHRRAALCCACVLWLLTGACHSDKSGSSSGAIRIQGNTPGQISLVAAEVLREQGYSVIQMQSTRLIAEKKGSRMDDFAYGNWIGDSPVWVRIELSVAQVAEATCSLQCQAYIVRDHGTASEERLKLSHLQTGSCKKIAEEVAARFQKH